MLSYSVKMLSIKVLSLRGGIASSKGSCVAGEFVIGWALAPFIGFVAVVVSGIEGGN